MSDYLAKRMGLSQSLVDAVSRIVGKEASSPEQQAAIAISKKEKGQKPKKEDNTNNKSDDGEGMDKVQPKALNKKFKDRKDKDIDNDGDVDGSDEYLHKRRKTVSKAIAKEQEDDSTTGKKPEVDDKEKDKKPNVIIKKVKEKNPEAKKKEIKLSGKQEPVDTKPNMNESTMITGLNQKQAKNLLDTAKSIGVKGKLMNIRGKGVSIEFSGKRAKEFVSDMGKLGLQTESLDEVKIPPYKEVMKIIGNTKNGDQAIALLKKKYGVSDKEADKIIRKTMLGEAEMTDAQMKRREEIVKELKKKEGEFKERYGDRYKEVMYATATKMAMKEK